MPHSVYVVGGAERNYRQLRDHFAGAGVSTVGHAEYVRDVSVPNTATAVVVITDMISHEASHAAKTQADKLGIPVVSGEMRWARMYPRLVTRGIIATPSSHATLGDIVSPEKKQELEKRIFGTVEEFAAAPVSAEDVTPPPEEPAVAAVPHEEPAQAPTPPLAVVVEATPNNEQTKMKRLTEDAAERQRLALQCLDSVQGRVYNKEVANFVRIKTGRGVTGSVLNKLRAKRGYPKSPHGGENPAFSLYEGEGSLSTEGSRVVVKKTKPATGHTTSSQDETALVDMVREYFRANHISEATFRLKDQDGEMVVDLEHRVRKTLHFK